MFFYLCIMKHIAITILSVLFVVSCASTGNYIFNEGKIGQIEPKGWIEEALQRQVDGLTGHPEAMDYPYNTSLWADTFERQGGHGNAWWRYEQTAYYTDGLLRTGYLLDNKELIAKGENGINHLLDSVEPSGRMGAFAMGDPAIDDPGFRFWPFAVFFRAVQAEYEETLDERIPAMLDAHYMSMIADSVSLNTYRDIITIEGLLWTYGKTGNTALLDYAKRSYDNGEGFPLNMEQCISGEKFFVHGVTYCEQMKLPILLYAYTGEQQYLDAALGAEQKLEDYYRLADGLFSCSEYLYDRTALSSHETCDITDYTWSLGYYLQVLGDGKWADEIEKVVFNAGFGAITKDFKALQYFSCPNQVIATGNSNHNEYFFRSTWMAYRPIHETECCSGNVHRFLPNYAARMWMTAANGDMVAAMYGPSEVSFGGLTITEDTSYPFDETINFRFSGKSTKNGFLFRIPGWSKSYTVLLNGRPARTEDTGKGYLRIERRWKRGDVLTVQLEAEPCVKTLENADGADARGLWVERGPLVYSLPVEAKATVDKKHYDNMYGKSDCPPDFPGWSFEPASKWNYAISSDTPIEVCRNNQSGYPFDPGCYPITLKMKASTVKGWKLNGGLTPQIPANFETGETEDITLIPYGATILRLTVFPEK